MQNLLYTYALIKSLSDEGEDYIDAFWPFTIRVIPHDGSVKIKFIQTKLLQEFNLDIPQHVLITILNRAKLHGHISYANDKYRLTKKGNSYQTKLESEQEVNRKINSLIDDIKRYFAENQLNLSEDEIKNLLNKFIQKNLEPLIDFFNPTALKEKQSFSSPDASESFLMKYIIEVEEKKPEEYKILNNMVLGSLIFAILYSPEPQELTKFKKQKFKDCIIYLDTNYVFSLFELHSPEYNKPALELYKILQKFNFEIKVFNFTVNEISRVVNRFGEEAHCYPHTIRIDTIYSTLKRMGWTKTTARMFISEIEEHLNEKNITVEWEPEIDLSKYKPKNPELIPLLSKYKPTQSRIAQNHDIAAIELIKKIRGKDVRKLENSVAIFVTSDRGLSVLNRLEMHHKDEGTIPEVISDRLLTNILWLIDPKIPISLNSIVAAYSRELFVKRRVWERFYKVLQELRNKKQITDGDIALLLLDKRLETDLKNIDELQIDSITPKFAMDEIEKAAQLLKEESKKRDEDQEKEFIEKIGQTIDEVEKKKDDEWLKREEQLKSNAMNIAEDKAKNLIKIIKALMVASLIVLIGIYYNLIAPIFSLIPVAMLLIVLLGIPFPVYWKKLENKLSDKFFTELKTKMQLKL